MRNLRITNRVTGFVTVQSWGKKLECAKKDDVLTKYIQKYQYLTEKSTFFCRKLNKCPWKHTAPVHLVDIFGVYHYISGVIIRQLSHHSHDTERLLHEDHYQLSHFEPSVF